MSQDEVGQLRQAEDDIIESGSDGDYEDARSITPNPRDVGVVSTEPIKVRNGISSLTEGGKSFLHRDRVSDIQPPPVTVMHMSAKEKPYSAAASDDNFQVDSNETSDTDLTPLPRPHQQHWMNKKFESDLSTAPFSSETSDMETSGNERVLTTDGGSATDLNPLKKSKPPGSPPTPSSSPSPMGKVPTQQNPSGSSGDEIKTNRLSTKSKLVAKPSPPPKKLSSAVEPPAVVRSPGPAKRSLHAAKSSPLGNKVSNGSSGGVGGVAGLRNQRSVDSISPNRSKSIKVNIPAKPKPPPIPAKPANKPELKPKPIRSTSVQQLSTASGAGSSAGASGVLSRVKTEVKPRVNSVEEGESGSSSMRKTVSDTELGVAKAVMRRSPTLGTRKLTQVREEVEKKRQSTPPRPPPPQTPIKPTVPFKPKRQPSEKKTKPAEQVNLVDKVASADNKQSFQSDSSKTPSSSETTTSGPSQSPTVSPYPSPNLSKRFAAGAKLAILPKKASIKCHQRAMSDSSRIMRKIETTDSVSLLTVVPVSTAEQLPRERSGARKEETSKRVEPKPSLRMSSKSPETKTPPIGGTISPPPPPIPPRTNAGRKSSHLELVIPVGETSPANTSPAPDSAHRKKLSAPRRPPPSPPSPLPKLLATEAQPTSNELTDSGSRMSQSSPKLFAISGFRPGSTAISDHYDVGVASWDPDSPQPYMYATVNKLKGPPERQRSKTPDFLSRNQESLIVNHSDVKKNSDSELEVTTKKRSKVVRRESSRRAPPKPPKYDTPDETTGYVPVTMETMAANQKKLGSMSPASRSSVSPQRGDDTPPPLPTQPIPKRKAALKKSASTLTERPKARDPVYDVIPDLRVPKKANRARYREYEEIDLIDSEPPPELLGRGGGGAGAAAKEPPVELVRTVEEALPHKQTQKAAQGNYAQLPIEDLRENWKTSPHAKRRPAKSFSGKKSQSLMYRRFSSERFHLRRVLTLSPTTEREVSEKH